MFYYIYTHSFLHTTYIHSIIPIMLKTRQYYIALQNIVDTVSEDILAMSFSELQVELLLFPPSDDLSLDVYRAMHNANTRSWPTTCKLTPR
jgi:hypothetical protein